MRIQKFIKNQIEGAATVDDLAKPFQRETPYTPTPIKIAPTWKNLMPVMLGILEHGSTQGKEQTRIELMRLAEAVDNLNQSVGGRINGSR